MNTEFYKQMLEIKQEKEMSSREFAKLIGLSYGLVIEFFNPEKEFRFLTDKTMYKINHNIGISYDVMKEYNKEILKERSK